MGKKKRELFISRVSEVMAGLYIQLSEVMETELKKFRHEADSFFFSPEKQQAHDFSEIFSECTKRRDERIREAGEKYMKSAGSDSEKALEKASEFINKDASFSADSFYSKVLWGFLELSDLSYEEKNNIGKKEKICLINFEKQWKSVEDDARKNHLRHITKTTMKPVRILHGTYGECTDCVGYDEEYKVYLLFSPDDNYRHWNDYDICIVTKSIAERYARQKFDFPETEINISNEILNYESTIKARII